MNTDSMCFLDNATCFLNEAPSSPEHGWFSLVFILSAIYYIITKASEPQRVRFDIEKDLKRSLKNPVETYESDDNDGAWDDWTEFGDQGGNPGTIKYKYEYHPTTSEHPVVMNADGFM